MINLYARNYKNHSTMKREILKIIFYILFLNYTNFKQLIVATILQIHGQMKNEFGNFERFN